MSADFFESHISLEELLQVLKQKYSRHTVYRWVGQGLPHKKVSGKLWFPKDEAINWLLTKG